MSPGTTPITQNAGSPQPHLSRQGRTPITKNVRVVDDRGTPLEPTYRKRALGLVKHGRAAFVDDSTIQLLSPSEPQGEEVTMSATTTEPVAGATSGQTTHTPGAILERIDRIVRENQYLSESLLAIQVIDVKGNQQSYAPEDVGNQARAEACAIIVQQREETNRAIIRLLERMYEDVAPESRASLSSRDRRDLMERLLDRADNLSEDVLEYWIKALT